MSLVIHLFEITLLLLVVTLGYRVVKAYRSEIGFLLDNCEPKPQATPAVSVAKDKMDGKTIVEAYIDDFFMAEADDPLMALKYADQAEVNTSSTEVMTQSKVENSDRSISSKVIDAMMAEADLACAS